tara:strand:+ start:962 stop:1957 length:996 start_codon:yes stop_codon:yes gene_type:complete
MELSATHKKLIRKLAGGQFFSGQQLADELGLSRTSIWNYLKVLETVGFVLHAVKGKGTRLESPLELLDKDAIFAGLSAPCRVNPEHLDLLDICPSTNQHLSQKNAQSPLANGAVCLAEMQTAGRGRLGRTWVSPYGQNIYVSFLWRFKQGITGLSGLSLACGVSVCQALSDLGIEGHRLKWPNDILWQGKKLGGILVEIQGESQGEYTAIIGIGINYKMNAQTSANIDQPWADISHACADRVGRNELASRLIEQVLGMLEGYEKKGLAPYVERWNDFDGYYGKNVQILSGQSVTQGVAQGISPSGELQLLLPNGDTQGITSGEVSLRLDVN